MTTLSVTGSTSMRQRWRPSTGQQQSFLKFLISLWNLTFFIRSNLEKSFKKNIDGGYFPFLVVDAINEKVDHFSGMWSHAKQNGFEVYVCEVEVEVSVATDRNVHGRTGKEVVQLSKAWEATPSHMNTLDVRALLQDDAIQHVDMEEDPPEEDKKSDDEVVELDNEVSNDAVGTKKLREKTFVWHQLTLIQDSEGDNSQEASFLSASKWDVLDSGERMGKFPFYFLWSLVRTRLKKTICLIVYI